MAASLTKKTVSHPFGISAFRLVLNTLPRFISIFLITMIGVAFFSGLRVTGNYMRVNADSYLNSQNTMDIRVVSTFGIDDDDLAAIRSTSGVADVYPGYNYNLLVNLGDSAVSSQVLSIDPRGSDAINIPWLVSGRMPKWQGECLVEKSFLRHSQKSLGDSVVFLSGNESDLNDILVRDSFTIVGVVECPLFLAEDRGSSEIGNGSNSYFFLIPESNFKLSVYTEIYIRCDSVAAQDSRFTDEYNLAVTEQIYQLENTAELRQPLRYKAVVDEATSELDDAQKEVDDGYTELEDARLELQDARRELDDGWLEIADARRELDDGWLELADARRELDDGWAELYASRPLLDDSWVTLNDSRVSLDDGWAELALSRQALDDGWAAAELGWKEIEAGRVQLEQSGQLIQLAWDALNLLLQYGLPQWLYDLAAAPLRDLEQQYLDGLAEWQVGLDLYNQSIADLEEGEALYAEGKAELEGYEDDYQSGLASLTQAEIDYQDGIAKLNQAEIDYSTGLAKLEQGELDYREGLAELVEAEQDYAEGLAEYQTKRDDALVELADAQTEIDEGWADLRALKQPQWYVLGIRDNAGFRTFESEAAQLDALALILPGFFFLIAALVSMTAMTRLVDAERTTIATFKALGYKNIAISLRYLLYALVATSIGSVAGIALGFSILPPMIFDAFRTLFNIPHTMHPFSYEYTLISAAVAIITTVLPAMFVVRSSVRETPSQAMRPLAPKAGRRIFLEKVKPLWQRLSFLQKITARNLFRYKKRLLMTVFGVAGCTGLIFTALGLNDSLGTLTSKQFGQIYKSDVTIDFRLADDETLADFTARLDDSPDVKDYTPIYQRSMRISSPDLTKDISLIVVFDPDSLPEFIRLEARRTGWDPPPSYALDDNGVILTEQIARQFGVDIGGSINLRTLEGDSATFTVSGIVENYTMHYCYMTPAVFERAYDQTPEPNRFFIISHSGQGELPQSLLEDKTVVSVMYTTVLAGEVDNQLDVLTFVVVILIASAGILIFVVLFSLTTINIEERRRELASIKVLGFTDRELASYIYRENIILTIAGAIVGIGLGFLLQRYIITTLEIDMFMFSRDLLWTSYLISLALTFCFAVAVNLMMYRPLTRIDMVEALKAVE